MLSANAIGHLTELGQVILCEVQLLSGFKADRVEYEVGVDVIGVGMRCHHHFVRLPLLRQLQGNGVSFFGGELFLRREGLDEVKI